MGVTLKWLQRAGRTWCRNNLKLSRTQTSLESQSKNISPSYNRNSPLHRNHGAQHVSLLGQCDHYSQHRRWLKDIRKILQLPPPLHDRRTEYVYDLMLHRELPHANQSSIAQPAANPYADVKSQKSFEKGLLEKTAKQTQDIILYDNRVVLYKMESDIMMYVVGGIEENEIMLYNVILAIRDSLHLLFK